MTVNLTPQDAVLPNRSGLQPSPGNRMPLSITIRLAAALLGSYAFTWGFSTLGVTGLVALGVDFHEAETALLLLAFLPVYAVLQWIERMRVAVVY